MLDVEKGGTQNGAEDRTAKERREEPHGGTEHFDGLRGQVPAAVHRRDTRTSRLGANLPLIKANLCPLSFIDVPERAYIESTLAVYEERRIEPQRDLFAWAYERSCEQYRVTREALGQPDPIRLRYRPQLGEVVRETVLELRPPQRTGVRAWAEAHEVPAADVDAFTDTVLGLLIDLHEGALARYGLRPR